MPASLDPGVQRRIDAPSEGETVTVLVKVESPDDATLDSLGSVGKSLVIDDILELGYLRLTIDEGELSELCSHDDVQKVEIEKGGEIMSSDFRTRTGQTL